MASVTQRAQTDAAAVPSAGVGRRFDIMPYLFILPHLIFFVLFLLWPLLYGIYISLFEFDFNNPAFRPFVGIGNYRNLADPNSLEFDAYWNSMKNTLIFVVISTIPMVLSALLLAVLLNGKYRFRNVFRGIFFAPWSLSAVVAALLGWWIFNDQAGIMNGFLDRVGLGTVAWLGAQPGAWIAIVVVTLWWTVGFNTIIYLAALQDIPESLYEAASLDGANLWHKFRYITVPMVAPVTVFIVTIQLIASFQLFAQPQIMTRGGPAESTKPVIMQIYQEGFGAYRMGSAAAMSIVLGIILLIITTLNFRIFGRSEER